MNRMRTLGLVAVLLQGLVLGSVGSARADGANLDDLRREGAVGERFDGFAMIHDQGAGADARAAVDTVNQQRREIYQGRAKQQAVPLEAVGKIYAAEIAGKAPAGTWFLGEDGQWTQRK